MGKLFLEKFKKGSDTKEKNENQIKTEKDQDILEKKISMESDDNLETDGQLTVDIYQTSSDLIIQSAVAGVDLKDLDISIDKDLILIKGKRNRPSKEKGDYFCKECYWGTFSRKIILPVEVNCDKIQATLKKGILTIKIPKKMKEEKRRIIVQK
jgi:HSP20 family protein